MKNSITPNQIKQNNQKLIYQYMYDHQKVSQQDLCMDLKLSRPTVMTNLNRLEELGMIEKSGQMASEMVGRKAAAYSIVANYRVAVGVEIVRREVKIMALDLYGERLDRVAVPIPFENSDSYFRSVSAQILSFISDLRLSEEQILGVGFAMQALVSPDGSNVVYGKILSCTGLSIDAFKKYLPYPCRFIHDAESAAFAELWGDPDMQDAFYISLSKHVAGAIIHNRQILPGKHGHSATFEHIQIRPANGKYCYCGKAGCIDTLCSLHDLLHEDEDLDNFFAKKKTGDPDAVRRWTTYLQDLGEVLNLLHLIYDTDLVLGGYLAPYLEDEDLRQLYARIEALTPFEEPCDFLKISRMPRHSITIGGALLYIRDFLQPGELTS